MVPRNVQPKHTGKILHFPSKFLIHTYTDIILISYVLFQGSHIHKHEQRRKSLLSQDLISKKYAMHVIHIGTTKIGM